ncbi:MAG: LysR family transcriptional regulator [Deltaproteobacteria bacterium]|nr:LysR family transcriptional regulator [Deltaproteobacteria bacterium]
MELRHLRYFVAVAEELHFGRAARRLALSQPPLSAAIRELEDELGAALFARTTRSVALTPIGTAFLGRARDVLRRTRDALDDVARAGRGEIGAITVGYATAATYALLPGVVRTFAARHPGLRLTLVELASAAQIAALQNGAIDVGLVCLPVALDGVTARVVRRDGLVVALPKGHALAKRAAIPIAALDGQRAVIARQGIEPGWTQATSVALARTGVALDVVQEADTKLAVLALVAAGLGVALFASGAAELGRAGVVFRPVTGTRVRFELAVAHVTGAQNPAIPRFLDAIT